MTALSKTLKAAAMALVMGGGMAMPVQAQSPDVDFNFRFGGPGFSIGIGNDRYRPGRPGRHCLSDREVRRALNRIGYDDIRVLNRRGPVVQVLGERGRQLYRITYDTCRERILDRERVRRR